MTKYCGIGSFFFFFSFAGFYYRKACSHCC